MKCFYLFFTNLFSCTKFFYKYIQEASLKKTKPEISQNNSLFYLFKIIKLCFAIENAQNIWLRQY